MILRYLGTAAAEGWPALFCTCDACKRARTAGGRNIRTRSQAIIDDRLLIDFPADTYMHVLNNGLDLGNIRHCLVTHDHMDHLYAPELRMRDGVFAHVDGPPLKVYGTRPATAKVDQAAHSGHDERSSRFQSVTISPFESFMAAGLTITPLPANHDPKCDPVIYLIADGSQTILYAHDTGYFPDATWLYLDEKRPQLDLVSLDCTTIHEFCRDGHMGLSTVIEVKDRLRQLGCINDQTRLVLNHFSHNGGATYDELLADAQSAGFEVAFDGMAVDLGPADRSTDDQEAAGLG